MPDSAKSAAGSTPAAAPPAASPEEVAEFRNAQEKEWGTYVALTDISVGGALAYTAGDPVPVSNVERFGYDASGLVDKVTSKAAQDVIAAEQLRARPASQKDLDDAVAPVHLGVPLKS